MALMVVRLDLEGHVPKRKATKGETPAEKQKNAGSDLHQRIDLICRRDRSVCKAVEAS